jgi:hypothetical protein
VGGAYILGGCVVYGPNDWFTTNLLTGDAGGVVPTTVDPNSAAIISHEISYAESVSGGSSYVPEFGYINASTSSVQYSADPANFANDSTPTYPVYWDSSLTCSSPGRCYDDPWNDNPSNLMPVQSGFVAEGGCSSGDCHAISLNTQTCVDVETWGSKTATYFNGSELQAENVMTHNLNHPYNAQISNYAIITAGGIPELGMAELGDDEENYIGNHEVIPHVLYALIPGTCGAPINNCDNFLGDTTIPPGAPNTGGGSCSPVADCFRYGMRLQLNQSLLPGGSCAAAYPTSGGWQGYELCEQLVQYGLLLSDIGSGCNTGAACAIVMQLTADHNNNNPWVQSDIGRVQIPWADFQVIKQCGGNTGVTCTGP